MKNLKFFTGFFIALLIPALSWSQVDLNKPAPMDPEIRTGKLENGLTYFIRKNKEPEKRASFYFIQNTGAIIENDNETGLAHFLEHMSLNGTEHFPKKGIISGLEKHGVSFGSNINAGTSFDETVYNLSNVPVNERPDLIDTCLLILYDWSDLITLEDKEIDLERGVILEEWRTREDAGTRMFYKKVIPVLLKDSKYAIRDIIGDQEIIKSFPYNTLRNFYHNWYRTDLQAIVVTGDINMDEVEAKIKALFSKLEPVKNPPERTFSEVPYHKETYFVLATDKEAYSTSVSIIRLHDNIPPEGRNLKYLRDNNMISLMNSMMGVRINELLQKGNPPFVSGSVFYGEYLRKYDAFQVSAAARQNEEAAALEAIYTEAERARRFGFGKAELDRAKARTLSNLENTFKQKDKISNDTYASWVQQYFLTGEPATSADFDLEFFRQIMDGITAEEISAKFREVMADDNRTIVVQGLEGENIKHLSEQEAYDIINKVKNATLTPYEDKAMSESLVNDVLKGSKIIKTVPLPQFDAVEWTLANNAKVVYRKADFEKDNIILSSFSFGGISKLDNDLVLAANLMPSLISMYGAGDYDNITLQKMLSGKKDTVSLSLGEVSEAIGGSSTPKDFETMMQLLYLKFAKPRFDKEAHNAIIARYAAMIGNQEKSPDKIKSDSISLITTGYNPRTVILSKENIGKITLDQIQKIYADRFKGADEFTFIIVGNIEKEEVIPMVEKYIGSLPVANRTETWIDRKVEQPKGKITKELPMVLTIPKSTVFLSFSKDFRYNPYNYLGLQVISGILDIVYTEKIRENEGGTYGVSVSFSAQKRPSEKGEGYVMFDCDPARANALKDLIYKELDTLVQIGPSQENLDKTVLNILKNLEENKKHNSYWSSTISRYYNYGINSDDPKNYEDILKSYTVKDIRKIAAKMLKKADVVDLIFKPVE
ncbi:MAG: insulinase family protein [Bacteroidia bacterium]|nr:insulinase family protein [Bacteroidia bacterium]